MDQPPKHAIDAFREILKHYDSERQKMSGVSVKNFGVQASSTPPLSAQSAVIQTAYAKEEKETVQATTKPTNNLTASKREFAIAIAIQAGEPVILWGPPGAGKTSFVNSLGHQLKMHVETVIASIREPSDFGGLPYRHGDEVRLSPPSWAKRLVEAAERGQRGLLFLDEITCTSPATQAALLRVILDKAVGDLQLPPTTAIVAAANPPEIAAGGWELALPLLNRFMHIEWEIDHQKWCNGIINGFNISNIPQLPDNWHDTIPEWRTNISRFIQHIPKNLLRVPTSNEAAQVKAFPTPRTWEMAARLCAAARSADSKAEISAFLTGTLGTAMSIEFGNWLGQSDLTDPAELLKNPGTYTHVAAADARHTLMDGVVSLAIKQGTKQAAKNAAEVLFRAVVNANAPGEFAKHVKKLADNTPEKLLDLIEDAQMRSFFTIHFFPKDKKA